MSYRISSILSLLHIFSYVVALPLSLLGLICLRGSILDRIAHLTNGSKVPRRFELAERESEFQGMIFHPKRGSCK